MKVIGNGINFILVVVVFFGMAVLFDGDPDLYDILMPKLQQAAEAWQPGR